MMRSVMMMMMMKGKKAPRAERIELKSIWM